MNMRYTIGNLKQKFTVIIQPSAEGYVGQVPELHNFVSQGNTIEELIANIKEATEARFLTAQERESLSSES